MKRTLDRPWRWMGRAILLWGAGIGMAWATAPAGSTRVESHFSRGLALEKAGSLAEALEAFRLAAQEEPQNAQVATALGVVASRLGHYEEARSALEKSLALDAGSVASYFHLALLAERQQQNAAALQYWRRFLDLSRDAGLQEIARKHIRRLEGGGISQP